MIRQIASELLELKRFLKCYYTEIIILSSAVLYILLHDFHFIYLEHNLGLLFFYGVLPLLTIVIVLRKNPLDFGLRLGNYKRWLGYVLVFLVICLPLLYLAVRLSPSNNYHFVRDVALSDYTLQVAIGLLGWEFLFRGYLLFGLKKRLGELAILVQMVPFALLHMGKPEIEAISCIVTGILWGYFAYRGNSFWPAFILHLAVNVANKVFVSMV